MFDSLIARRGPTGVALVCSMSALIGAENIINLETPDAVAEVQVDNWQGNQPTLVDIGQASPDTLWLRVTERTVERHGLEPYVAQAGDDIVDKKEHKRRLVRDGKEVGYIAGPADNRHLRLFDGISGKPLQLKATLDPAQWIITVNGKPAIVTSVARKSKPYDKQFGDGGMCQQHELFVTLEGPIAAKDVIMVNGKGINIGEFPVTFIAGPMVRSEAIHVNHIGWRPDDLGKYAYVSMWMGTGGSVSFPAGMAFTLRDANTGKQVFASKAQAQASVTTESFGSHAKGRNFASSDVVVCDFSSFTKPGTYVISIDGLGCSYPFPLANDAWDTAVKVINKGFFHQRSGLAYAPPMADYTRPRSFHPEDGIKPIELSIGEYEFSSTIGDGNLHRLLEFRTDTVLSQAWGGVSDAGDYDRRVRHLGATREQLEVIESWPAWAKTIQLPIPEANNDLPDLLDEALWNLNCYKRMQREDGAVYGGIETDGHPAEGEPGWLNSLTVMVFAPDARSGWQYAATAAQAAYIFKLLDQPKLAAEYRDSALRAMVRAEAYFADKRSALESGKGWWREKDLRHIAALMCYRTSGDEAWHAVVKETCGYTDGQTVFKWTSHDQGDAAYVYARLPKGLGDDTLRTQAQAALANHAAFQIDYASKQPYPFCQKDVGGPLINSSFSAPRNSSIARMYALTGEDKYLQSLVATTGFSVGNNPMNMALTTGLGYRSPQHILYVDWWHMNLPQIPTGIPVYGPADYEFMKENWGYKWILTPETCAPHPGQWPVLESYFDVPNWPMQTEYTISESLGPAALVWGHLAGRPERKRAGK